MQTNCLTLTDPDVGDVTLTLCRADVRRDIQRSRLEMTARQAPVDDPDAQLFATDVYPLLVAGTVAVEGLAWPLTVEDLLSLPSALVLAWRNAIWDLNPAWRPAVAETPTEKKDAPPTSIGA